MRRLTLAPFLLILALAGRGAEAEPARWSALAETVFRHLGTEDGLPHQDVNAIVQDGDGFIWVGTGDGLARWDGYQFRLYRRDPNSASSLPDNYVRTLYVDREKRLWIGTPSAGLVRYDARTDRFERIELSFGQSGHPGVRRIVEDETGAMWIATDAGLARLDPTNGTFADYTRILPDRIVDAMITDRHGKLWIGTRQGLIRLDAHDLRPEQISLSGHESASHAVTALAEDSRGQIWVGTGYRGIVVLSPEGDGPPSVRASSAPSEDKENGGPPNISIMADIGEEEIWVGTRGNGILDFDQDGTLRRWIRHDPVFRSSLSHNHVRSIFRDRQGIVWIGGIDGIDRLESRGGMISTVFGAAGIPGRISDPDIDSVMSAPDGKVWLGLAHSGANLLDPRSGQITQVSASRENPDISLRENFVVSMMQTPGGDILFGSANGLYRADRNGGHLSRLPLPRPIANATIYGLLQIENTLWIGTNESGLWKADPAHPELAERVAARDLTDQRIRTLALDRTGGLWVGTYDGLNRIDLASGKVMKAGLQVGLVTSLLIDRRGRLWVSALGGGVNLCTGFDAEGKPEFRHIGPEHGLPSDNADKLLEDKDGQIWVSTSNGLAVIGPESLAVRSLHAADGVAIHTFRVGSGTTTPDGELLFGGLGGLTIVQPRPIADWTYDPPVVISDLRVGGRDMSVSAFGNDQPVLVAPDANSLAVQFSALDFSNPKSNNYAYRLDGYDPDWIETDSERRVAAYTNLPPGDYVLRIRGTNRAGAWSSSYRTLPVKVLPAWYQTIWFRLIEFLIAGLIVAGAVQFRTLVLRQRQQALERLVADRTAALTESQRKLELMAYTDMLTGLPNRRMFTDQLHRLISLAHRASHPFTLLLLDLDHFKQINDTLGHDAGDALLIEAAKRFSAAVRDSDFVARLGGDEFAILLIESCKPSEVETVCRRIVESFAEPIPFGTTPMKTTPSIGIAIHPDHDDSVDGLLKAADVALYAAKGAGRNTWRWYETAESA